MKNEEADIFSLMDPVELTVTEKKAEEKTPETIEPELPKEEKPEHQVSPCYRSPLPMDRLNPAVLVWRLQEKLSETTDEKLCAILTDTICFINTSMIQQQPRIEPTAQSTPSKEPTQNLFTAKPKPKPIKPPETKTNHRILGVSIVIATAVLVIGLIITSSL